MHLYSSCLQFSLADGSCWSLQCATPPRSLTGTDIKEIFQSDNLNNDEISTLMMSLFAPLYVCERIWT